MFSIIGKVISKFSIRLVLSISDRNKFLPYPFLTNKRVNEHVSWAGAFDTLLGNRAQKTNELTTVIDLAAAKKKAEATGQMDLFSLQAKKSNTQGDNELYSFGPCAAWTDKEKLEKEKEGIGFYLSAHPLESYSQQLKWLSLQSFQELKDKAQEVSPEHEIMSATCGLMKSKREIITKKGDRMAFVQLEDMHTAAEIILFPKTFAQVEQWLDDYHVFFIKGPLDLTAPEKCKIIANELKHFRSYES